LRVKPRPEARLSRSLEYGVATLECFTAERPVLRISELADMLGLSRSTAHRYALTLTALGYLYQDSKRRYRLAHRAARAGASVLGTIRLETPAREIIEELRHATGYTVGIGVLEGTRALYIQRLFAHGIGQYDADLGLAAGAHIPVYCTALGKALLANLHASEREKIISQLTLTRHGPSSPMTKKSLVAEIDLVRGDGIATSDEELAQHVRSIAVPIHAPHARAPTAVDVTVPSRACTARELVTIVGPHVRRAAARIAQSG
jgi:IclR family pca regulon transcriptional regulator